MSRFNRKSRLQRTLASVGAPFGSSTSRSLPLPRSIGSSKSLKRGLPSRDTATKAGLIAGGLAGVTAGSAGISSLRRRREGAGADS